MPFPRLDFTSTLGRRIRGRPTERFESFVKSLLVGVLFRFLIIKADKSNYNISDVNNHFPAIITQDQILVTFQF